MTEKKIKKITLGPIFSWIFGVLFMMAGAGMISASPVAGIVIVLCSAMIIPYFNRLIAEKLSFEISGGIKFALVIVILIATGFAMAAEYGSPTERVDTAQLQPVEGQDSGVREDAVPSAVFNPALNKKTEYIKNYVLLKNVEVGEGYGQLDVAGYDPKKPTVEGRIRNTGSETLKRVRITVYFLDAKGTRIGEKQYSPVSEVSLFGDATPLKPNYVKDWGYVVDDAPPGWAKKVEVVVSDISFDES